MAALICRFPVRDKRCRARLDGRSPPTVVRGDAHRSGQGSGGGVIDGQRVAPCLGEF
jgi:hypothetical protein